MASQPSSAARRHMAAASAKLRAPSSTPGRMWQCRSIINRSIDRQRGGEPSGGAGLPGGPRLALLGAIGFIVPVALAEARLEGAVAVEHRAQDLDARLAQAGAAGPRPPPGAPRPPPGGRRAP